MFDKDPTFGMQFTYQIERVSSGVIIKLLRGFKIG